MLIEIKTVIASMLDIYSTIYRVPSVMCMTDTAYIDTLSPGELFALLADRKSVIDLDIPIEEQGPGQLLLLELNKDEFERYKRDLYQKLMSEAKENPTVGALIKHLYGNRT